MIAVLFYFFWCAKTVTFHLTTDFKLEKRKRHVNDIIKQRVTTQKALVVAKPELIHSVFMFFFFWRACF